WLPSRRPNDQSCQRSSGPDQREGVAGDLVALRGAHGLEKPTLLLVELRVQARHPGDHRRPETQGGSVAGERAAQPVAAGGTDDAPAVEDEAQVRSAFPVGTDGRPAGQVYQAPG